MTLQRFVIYAEHPSNGHAYDVQLIATSERAAIARTRGTLMHRDRDCGWLVATYTVTSVRDYETGRARYGS